MTGFGTASFKVGSRTSLIEVKSVNHKFCEINLRISNRYSILEKKILEQAKGFFHRGRIDIFIKDEWLEQKPSVKIDFQQIANYLKQIKELQKKLKLDAKIDLTTLLSLPNVTMNDEDSDVEKVWPLVKKSLLQSFNDLEKMRNQEGKALEKEYRKYLEMMSKSVIKIETWIPEHVNNYEKKLKDRMEKSFSNEIEIDVNRLAQELIYFVDRTDITEELVRLKSHIDHFRHILMESGPIGRKIDFLLQEMNREVNTASAKSASARISQEVVELKQLIEKMREQIQNVE